MWLCPQDIIPSSTGDPHLWDADRASVHALLAPTAVSRPILSSAGRCLDVVKPQKMSSICSMSCFGQMMIMSAHKIDNNTCE